MKAKRTFPFLFLWLCIAAHGVSPAVAARPAGRSAEELRAASAIEDKRRDLGLPASAARPQPDMCRQEVRCLTGRRAACGATGDYTQCERLLGNDGTLLGAVCLGHEASGESGAGRVSVRQVLCAAGPR